MKNIVFCLVLFLSFFMFFACPTNPPPPAPVTQPAPPPPEPAPAPPPPAVQPTRTTDLILDDAEYYTVVDGDTLAGISTAKYLNSSYYPIIMLASSDVVEDQDLLEPGMVLTIPRLDLNLEDARARSSVKRFLFESADITERTRPRDAEVLRNLADSL